MEAALLAAVRPLLLLSVIVMTFVVPSMVLRRTSVVRFAPMFRAMAAFVLFYVFALLVIYPRLP